MSLIDKLFPASYSYFQEQGVSLVDALRMTEVLLLEKEVEEGGIGSYIDDLIILTNLLYKYQPELTEEEAKLYKIENLEKVKTHSRRKDAIDTLKSKRLAVYNKHYTHLLEKLVAIKAA